MPEPHEYVGPNFLVEAKNISGTSARAIFDSKVFPTTRDARGNRLALLADVIAWMNSEFEKEQAAANRVFMEARARAAAMKKLGGKGSSRDR